jgi:hypothetical protein
MRVMFDVEDLVEHREFFGDFKEQLKIRFRQFEIYMTTHLLEVI